MKNLFTIILTLSAMALPLAMNAQASFGPRLGAVVANQNFSNSVETDERFGIQGGIFFNIPLSNTENGGLAIQPELMYVETGYKDEVMFSGSTISADFNINYIQLPVLLQFNYMPDKVGFLLQAGPSISYALSGYHTLRGRESEIFWRREQYDRFDFGVQMGAGILIKVGEGSLLLDGRYILGISDISSDTRNPAVEINNRAISASIGYRIPLSN